MTDAQMDARLRRAGEAWRACNTISESPPGESMPLTIGTRPRPPRSHRWMLLASVAVVAAALVAGGAVLVASVGKHSLSGAGSPPLVGTRWTLVHITTAAGRNVPVVSKADLRIDPSGRFSGAAGCNSLSGRADVRDHRIRFRDVGSTLVFCRAELATEEREVRAVLSGSTAWMINGYDLTISKAGAGTLVYRDADISALVGKTWRLSAGGHGLWRLTLTLRSDSTFEFDAYCFGRAGTYKIDGDELELSTAGTFGSERCDSGPAHAAIEDVDGTLHWSVANGQLALTKGGTTLDFTIDGVAAAVTPLLGTAWTMSGFDTGRKLPHPDYGSAGRATVVLDIDRTGYRLDTRCRAYSGSARTGGSALTLGSAYPAGGRACANPAIEDDVAVLPGSYDWLIIGHRLYLSAADQTDIEFQSCGSTSTGGCR